MAQGVALQIGEVAKKAGVSIRTVRYYEELGLLRPPLRTSAGTRLYSETEAVRLRFIRRLKALGLGLDEIKMALASEQPPRGRRERVSRTLEVLLLEQQRADEQLAALQQIKEDVEDALANVRQCTACTVEECPENCQRHAYLL